MPPKSARKMAKGSSLKQRRARAAARSEGRDDRSDYKNKRRVEKMAEAEKKSGCLPKIGMLVLPFLAIGVYFLLS